MHDLDSLLDGTMRLMPLPQAYFRIRDLVNDPGSRAHDIAAVIANEPVLTARILRVANSPWFGRRAQIDTVDKAVRVLGLDEIRDLALAVSAVSALGNLDTALVTRETFWRDSVHCAVLASRMGRRLGEHRGEQLFVAGLLHAVGHLILCARRPEQMLTLMKRAAEEGQPLHIAELIAFGYDYAEVGAELMRRWDLPEVLSCAVHWHTRPGDALEHVIECSILHIAAVLGAGARWSSDQPDTAPVIEPVALQIAGIDAQDIDTLLADAEAAVADTLAAFLPPKSVAPARRAATA